jgi:tetratricopeptide (TPR) repeat protein
MRPPFVRLAVVCFLAVTLGVGCAAEMPLPPKALELNRNGAAALAAGDLETAEARLALAVEYSPRFTEAWVNLGLLELRRGHLEKAQKDLRKAVDLNPDLASPHHGLGLLAEKRGRIDEAEGHYRAALKVDPGFAPARANLGRRLFERAQWEAAREQFLRLTEVAPESLEGVLGLIESLLRLEREGEADEVLGRARASFGDRGELVLLVARQLLRRGAFAEAEAILAPLTSDDDRSRRGVAWSFIAVARLADEKRDLALAAARESTAIDPRDPVAAYVVQAVSALNAAQAGAALNAKIETR